MGVFGDINSVEVLGNITQDLEIRYTAGGTAVLNFSIATNRSFKQNDEWQEEVTFHNIVVWSNDAEQVAKRGKKGTRVFVRGRMQTRSWEDSDGKKNYRTEVVADKVILLDRYEKGSSEELGIKSGGSNQNSNFSKSAVSNKSQQAKTKKDDNDIIDPDDLPF